MRWRCSPRSDVGESSAAFSQIACRGDHVTRDVLADLACLRQPQVETGHVVRGSREEVGRGWSTLVQACARWHE